MDRKLTTTDQKSSDYRVACSNDHAGLIAPPKRALELDHQGAQSGCAQIGRFWPATVVAPRTGGASQSKWTRKTQPWNASLRTTVVAFVSIEEPRLENSECMPTHPGSRHQRRSPASRSEAMAGFLREIPATKLPKVGSRITAPPSGVRLGGGDRKTPFVVTESMRRRCEWHR